MKFKLLLYYLLVQTLLFLLFGGILIKFLQDAMHDKMEATLKVIILDIKDDIIEHHIDFEQISLEEEVEEFDFRPLFIKILRENEVFSTHDFPKNTPLEAPLENDKIFFKLTSDRAIAILAFTYQQVNYTVQLVSIPKKIEELFPNLRYIIIFIVPIVLLFAVLFGNILISRAFRPIELLLQEIQSIGAKSLSKRVQTRKTNDEIDQISQEINKLLDRVDKAYTQISQFTGDVSHELKTPLTIMRGGLEVALNNDRPTQEYKNVLKSTLDEVLSVQQMIENLLLVAKLDTTAPQNIKEMVYLDEILLEVTHELKPLAEKKQCTLEVEIKEAVSLYANEHLLKIAIKNILQNSIFYSHAYSKIFICLEKHQDTLLLSIEDFGIGMAEQTVENIFEKFYRGDESRSKHTGGSGLGMSIVKKILVMHEIAIHIHSTLGEGTKVTLSAEDLETKNPKDSGNDI
ncbi:MAG: HAMP domain-containing protein [Campylobacterales bacterium]|nr:HAMP domain-containing protein [Campylobacterales bacterium]